MYNYTAKINESILILNSLLRKFDETRLIYNIFLLNDDFEFGQNRAKIEHDSAQSCLYGNLTLYL